jgi:hypothetical protein
MKYKIIIHLSLIISSFFLSQAALAGPTYLNVSIPEACGDWKVMSHNHCPLYKKVEGRTDDMAYAKCVGGGNGKSDFNVSSASCGNCLIATENRAFNIFDTLKDNAAAAASAAIVPGGTSKVKFGLKAAAKIGKQVYDDQVHKIKTNRSCGIVGKVGSNTFNIGFNKPKGLRLTTEVGVDFVGNQYKVIGGQTPDQCKDLCRGDDKCKVYTHGSKTCYLKTGHGYKIQSGGVTSGEKVY